ncbi:hypothetical protein V8F33_010980, partial [Rhypophila sp. PSN 637]
CRNCLKRGHRTRHCLLPCGYCGDLTLDRKRGQHHKATHCRISWYRCKCSPFPNFHLARNCKVLCHRACGNTENPPGHESHRNAMLCRSRCCMCGRIDHHGLGCLYKRCKCGGQHLGQDCTWRATCPWEGPKEERCDAYLCQRCDAYLCPQHCWECGST